MPLCFVRHSEQDATDPRASIPSTEACVSAVVTRVTARRSGAAAVIHPEQGASL